VSGAGQLDDGIECAGVKVPSLRGAVDTSNTNVQLRSPFRSGTFAATGWGLVQIMRQGEMPAYYLSQPAPPSAGVHICNDH
jgi:hypothetical protein